MSFSVSRTTKRLLRGLLATRATPSTKITSCGFFKCSRITNITIDDKTRTIAFCIKSKRGSVRASRSFNKHFTTEGEMTIDGTMDDVLTVIGCSRHRFDMEISRQIIRVLNAELERHLAQKLEDLVKGL